MTARKRPPEGDPSRADRTSPWAGDLAALREHTLHDLPTVAETERMVLASTNANQRTPDEESTIMSLFRKRPLMTAAIIALSLLVLVPVSYAVVSRILITIDPDRSEEEIEEDVRQQLESAGVTDPQVDVTKEGDTTEISIHAADDHAAGALANGLDVAVRGGPAGHTESRRFELSLEGGSPEEIEAARAIVTGPAFLALAKDGPGERTDEEYAAAIEALFAAEGVEVEATVDADRIHIALPAR